MPLNIGIIALLILYAIFRGRSVLCPYFSDYADRYRTQSRLYAYRSNIFFSSAIVSSGFLTLCPTVLVSS